MFSSLIYEYHRGLYHLAHTSHHDSGEKNMSNDALTFLDLFPEVTHVSPVHIAGIGQTKAHSQHNFKSSEVVVP